MLKLPQIRNGGLANAMGSGEIQAMLYHEGHQEHEEQ
jgi:hypothetical protein